MSEFCRLSIEFSKLDVLKGIVHQWVICIYSVFNILGFAKESTERCSPGDVVYIMNNVIMKRW